MWCADGFRNIHKEEHVKFVGNAWHVDFKREGEGSLGRARHVGVGSRWAHVESSAGVGHDVVGNSGVARLVEGRGTISSCKIS